MNSSHRIIQTAIATLSGLFLFGYSLYKWHDNSKWGAIIAFSDTPFVSEDWSWFFDDLQIAAEGKNIFVINAPPLEKQVVVGSSKKPLAVIDISEYYKYHQGYLFVKKGEKVKYQKYEMSEEVLKKASVYFGRSLNRQSNYILWTVILLSLEKKIAG